MARAVGRGVATLGVDVGGGAPFALVHEHLSRGGGAARARRLHGAGDVGAGARLALCDGGADPAGPQDSQTLSKTYRDRRASAARGRSGCNVNSDHGKVNEPFLVMRQEASRLAGPELMARGAGEPPRAPSQ